MTTKTCKRCNRELPIEEFYVHKGMADGHLSFCKECTKKRVKNHRADNVQYYREYDRKRYQENPERREKQLEYQKKIRATERGKKQQRSHNMVSQYLEAPEHCGVCGCEGELHAHHYNGYEQGHELDVIWLCPSCHSNWHKLDSEMKGAIHG